MGNCEIDAAILRAASFPAAHSAIESIFLCVQQALLAIVGRPDFQKGLVDDALDPALGTPDEFAAQINADLASWAKLIKAVNVKVD